ncbi:MAG: TonB-dependent receptor [Acidobacteriota bacterium]|nr:TonB-dependent receptor [Acidobacteriota bacterium]
MKRMWIFVFAVCASLFLLPNTHAQGVGASGDLTGTITDPSGAAIANAQVSVSQPDRGFQRATTTDETGEYRFTGLAPANYELTISASGFAAVAQKGVTVTIGQITVADFQLSVASVAQEVEVTGAAPVVNVEQAQQANSISDQYITDLPINRRDYLTFTLLAPGVSNATRLASDQDFRVKQTPQSGLSFYGSNGRGNSFTVDGGEANDDSGGVRLNVSQDAVQEFQINRSNYTAELGGASGASINIVTKSGTNNLHGSLYGYFRNDALDARDPFAFTQALQPGQIFNPAQPDTVGAPAKNSLNRQQFGGTVGLPIQKDKTFLFGSFEGLRQDAQNAVPILTDTAIFRPLSIPQNNQTAVINGLAAEGGTAVPCLTGQPALPAATCAAILTSVLTVSSGAGPLKDFLINQFEGNGGLFPYATREYLGFVRLDHQFDEHNQLFVTYSYGHDREENPDVQSLTGFSRGSLTRGYDHTLQAAWFHQFSANFSNEARGQFNYHNFDVISNAPAEVGLDIPGFVSLGTNIFLPNYSILRRYEFADNVTLLHGHHTWKFGAEELIRGNHTEAHTFFPGRFVFGNLPGGILSPCLQVPAACGLAANPAFIDSLQSAALGLPQFYEQGFGNPVYNFSRPFTALYAQDSWSVASNLLLNVGLRYELDTQSGELGTDKDNFAPRISIAWDPFKDHKTVVRAGYGIFYSEIDAQIPDVVHTLGNYNNSRQISNFLVPLTGEPGNPGLTSAAIFQTLFAQGKVQCTTPAPGNAACITPANLTQFGINVSNTGALPPLTVLFAGQPDYQNPYSQQAELGVEREVAHGLSVSASYIYVHTQRLPVSIDTNLLPAPATSVPLANGGLATFRNWASPTCGANPFACFVNPLILQNNVYESKASALFQGGIFEVNKHFSDYFTLLANYTYSKAFSNSTDFNSDYAPQDETNLAAERALSDFDQRHKLVIAGVLEGPAQGDSLSARILSGFQLSPIFTYNSGHPFNLLAYSDVNGDRHYTNDRPIGARRNTGLGPDMINFDLGLSWRYKLDESKSVKFLVQSFNLFNRTNFASVNNVVGPYFGLPTVAGGSGATTFNVHGIRPGTMLPGGVIANPSTPLTFTSDFAKREIQMAVRFEF